MLVQNFQLKTSIKFFLAILAYYQRLFKVNIEINTRMFITVISIFIRDSKTMCLVTKNINVLQIGEFLQTLHFLLDLRKHFVKLKFHFCVDVR